MSGDELPEEEIDGLVALKVIELIGNLAHV
jgi:hypothetical protein